MRSHLLNFSLIKHHDSVSAHQCRHPVGDEDHRGISSVIQKRLPDPGVCLGVNCGKRVIKYHDRRLLQEHSGYSDPLPLASRQGYAPLTDQRIVSVRKIHNGVINTGNPGCLPDLLKGSLRHRSRYIFFDRPGIKERLLKHHSHILSYPFQGDFPDIFTAQSDISLPFLQLIQPV